MLNSCQIQGRLTAEPELNTSGSTQVVRFTLASQRSFKNKNGDYDADFIRCTAFGQRANFIAQHFHKGQKMIVEGRWQTGSYTDQQGNKVYTNDLMVSNTEFDESRSQGNQQQNNAQPNQPYGGYQQGGSIDIGDDELPF